MTQMMIFGFTPWESLRFQVFPGQGIGAAVAWIESQPVLSLNPRLTGQPIRVGALAGV